MRIVIHNQDSAHSRVPRRLFRGRPIRVPIALCFSSARISVFLISAVNITVCLPCTVYKVRSAAYALA
jgi:hypothetical protein